jgi:hypothetical protein
MYIFDPAIYLVSYLFIPKKLIPRAAWTIKVICTKNQSARSGLFRVVYPDTGESGDTYDIDRQTEPISKAWLEFKALPPIPSMRSLDTAESGDAYDAEVE